MQLFITDYMIEHNILTINEERVVHQLKNVLRAKVWDKFMVQSTEENIVTRITCSILSLDKEKITASVEEKNILSWSSWKNILFVALPNKFEKIELIVQKCTEIWLQHIVFFVSQYSQLHEISENKMQRLQKIALEATEQSYGINILTIGFVDSIEKYMNKIIKSSSEENNVQHDMKKKNQWMKNYLMHQDGELLSYSIEKNIFSEKNIQINIFVWPEWWRGNNDEKLFSQYSIQKISLWKKILRTETAAIIMAWELVK